MLTRCRWPPESWCGWRRAKAGGSPTRSSSSDTLTSRSARVRPLRPSATMLPTDIRGSSDEYGSWNTIWARRRRSRSRRLSAAWTSRPPMRIAPLVSGSRRSARRASVVLPEPDSPTSPRVSPLSIVSDTSSTAERRLGPPNARVLTGKTLVRCSISTSGAVPFMCARTPADSSIGTNGRRRRSPARAGDARSRSGWSRMGSGERTDIPWPDG